MKNIFCGLLLLCSFFCTVSVAATNYGDTVRVSLNPNFPPYSYVNEHGKLDGLDVDLIEAMSKRLKRPYKIVLGPLSENLMRLKNNGIDILFRESYGLEGIDSTMIYGAFNTYCIHSLVVRKNSLLRCESDLYGKTIAVLRHSTADVYLNTHEHNFKVRCFNTYEEVLYSVLEGSTDAAISNLYTVRFMIKYNAAFRGLHSKVCNLPPLPYYLIANKSNLPLIEDINVALRKMQSDGEFDEIYDKWLVKSSGKDYSPLITQLLVAIAWTVLVALFTFLFFKYKDRCQKRVILNKDEWLKKSKENLKLMLKDFPLPIYINDFEDGNKLIFINDAAREEEKNTKIDLKRTSFNQIEKVAKNYDMDVYSTGKTSSFKLPIFLNGVDRPITVLCNKYPVVIDERKCVLTSYYNVSDLMEEQYRLEEANKLLLYAKQQAEQAEQLKSAFLANMSHEIRTPLNAIEGFSNELIDAQDKDEQKLFSNIIVSNVELLVKLFDDVLDFSKMESKTFQLEPSTFNVVDVLKEKYCIWSPRFKEASLDFRLALPLETLVVKFDINRLMQIINNFLSNALKFTQQGYVEMGLEQLPGGVKVYVKDTGIGIPKDKSSIIGTRFGKVDSFKQGMGLGLAICKAIMQETNGEFCFESNENNGSCFWIVIR